MKLFTKRVRFSMEIGHTRGALLIHLFVTLIVINLYDDEIFLLISRFRSIDVTVNRIISRVKMDIKKDIETCRSDGQRYVRVMFIPLEICSRGIFVITKSTMFSKLVV